MQSSREACYQCCDSLVHSCRCVLSDLTSSGDAANSCVPTQVTCREQACSPSSWCSGNVFIAEEFEENLCFTESFLRIVRVSCVAPEIGIQNFSVGKFTNFFESFKGQSRRTGGWYQRHVTRTFLLLHEDLLPMNIAFFKLFVWVWNNRKRFRSLEKRSDNLELFCLGVGQQHNHSG